MSILGNAAILLGGLYLLSRSDEVQNNCGGNEPGSSSHPVDKQDNATRHLVSLQVLALKDQLLPSVSAASEASARPIAQMALDLLVGSPQTKTFREHINCLTCGGLILDLLRTH